MKAIRILVCSLFLAGIIPVVHAESYDTPVRISWQEDPKTTATLAWDTYVETRGTVRYGTTTNYTDVLHGGGGTFFHVFTLRNLLPGTDYFWEATTGAGYRETGRFRTAPADPSAPLHFAVHGDLQGGIQRDGGPEAVSAAIIAENPQWVIQMGDMGEEAYNKGFTSALSNLYRVQYPGIDLGGTSGYVGWLDFFRVCSNELSQFVFMPQIGNHENPDDAVSGRPYSHSRGLYHRFFQLPEPSRGNGYYAYGVGNIRFIVLNGEEDLNIQTNWLTLEVQAAVNDPEAEWVIVTSHRPPYSWGERAGEEDVKNTWSPIFARYGVNWMFAGHSHTYQRTVPIRGVNYMVMGGGGGRLYGYAQDSALLFSTNCYHYVSAKITNNVFRLEAKLTNGVVFDSVTVTNTRQVRVEPAFPKRGEPARIYFRPTDQTFINNPVNIHIGKDAFTSAFADTPMTWDAGKQLWTYDFTVPADATQRIAFVFNVGGTQWATNWGYDWQALLERVSVSPEPPTAGGTATIRYEGDMGPIVSAIQANGLSVWPSFRLSTGGMTVPDTPFAMANTTGSRWEATLTVPENATELILFFSTANNRNLDDNYKRKWRFPIHGATHFGWREEPYVASGSPVITDNPDTRNNVGDNFDFNMESPPLKSKDLTYGFGDWGEVYFNADETNLYVGGIGMDMGGTNNVFMLFLGLDTLTDNAWNLFHKSAPPYAVDHLHNLRFTQPMDVVILLGDQYGDSPAYTNYTYGGYDFGQGIFYIGTNSTTFHALDSAKLSQFDGTGTIPCATVNDSGTVRSTTRWEAAIPWDALGANGPEEISHLFAGGVIASSSTNGNDRYLSRVYLGEAMWGKPDAYGRYAYDTAILHPQRVNLLHADLLGEGIPNAWRLQHFDTVGGAPAADDTDADRFTNMEEYIAGTDPRDAASIFGFGPTEPIGTQLPLNWHFTSNRYYDLYFTTNIATTPFSPIQTGLSTGAFTTETNTGMGFYQIRVRLP